MLNEIEEFYSYVEMPQVAENLRAWEGSFPGSAYPVFLFHSSSPYLLATLQSG